MLITPDMSEVVEIGPGKYPVRVTGHQVKESKTTPGNFYVEWELAVFNAVPEINDRKLKLRTMTSGKGAGMLKRFYKSATNQDLPANGFEGEDLHGRELYATVDWQKNRDGSVGEFPEVKSVTAFNGQEAVLAQ